MNFTCKISFNQLGLETGQSRRTGPVVGGIEAVEQSLGSSFMSLVISDVEEWVCTTLIKSADRIGSVTNAEEAPEMIQIGLK